MTRDTTSIFVHSATLVPDIVTEAEERRILLRISQASWMTDLSRRVQHYGFKYDYGSPTVGVRGSIGDPAQAAQTSSSRPSASITSRSLAAAPGPAAAVQAATVRAASSGA